VEKFFYCGGRLTGWIPLHVERVCDYGRGDWCVLAILLANRSGREFLAGAMGSIEVCRGPSLRRAIPRGFVQDDKWGAGGRQVLSSSGGWVTGALRARDC